MKHRSLLAVSLLLFSHLLSAHSALKSSSPSNDETLNESPKKISLAFSDPVKLIKLELKSTELETVKTDFKPSMLDRKEFIITPSELSDGQYTVLWIIMGADGHKMKGGFTFKVMKTINTQHHDEHQH
jgi:methionine-rich copper-binding protein CopC